MRLRENKKKIVVVALIISMSLLIATPGVRAAINQATGMAVSESRTIWNNLKDAVAGQTLTEGVAAVQVYGYDAGTGTFKGIPGDSATGLWVNVKSSSAGGGTAFYAIKYTSVGSAASVNLPFGFLSQTLIVEAPGTNTDDLVIDWLGGTATTPAADTAGDDLLSPGQTVSLDNYRVTSVSVRSVSGAQTVKIRAFN